MDGTKFHPNGPGPSRALDPLSDAVWDARSNRMRPAVEGRSSDVHGPIGRFTKNDFREIKRSLLYCSEKCDIILSMNVERSEHHAAYTERI